MPAGSVWDEVLDTEHAVVVRTYIERWPRKGRPPEKVLIIVVEPDEETRCRCPRCGRRGPVAEVEPGRRWRTLDVHGKRCFLECDLPRIGCPEHGKITAAVPWARHDDRFSMPFEEHAAWTAAHMAWTRAVAELRITWEALASIVRRVTDDASAGTDRLEGLREIGIDEKSWGKGEGKYLTVVTDHAAGIHDVVRARAPQALICLDAFHVVKWAGGRLDELRRRLAAELRAAGCEDQAATLGNGMWALRKDYRKLSPGQRGALAAIAADNKPLYKAYLIKEQLREAFKVKGEDGKKLLRGLIAWAQRSRIPELVKLAKTLTRFRDLIYHTLDGGPSNGRAEALNSQLNALITRARGFRSAAALIAMAHLVHGGLCPDSPYA